MKNLLIFYLIKSINARRGMVQVTNTTNILSEGTNSHNIRGHFRRYATEPGGNVSGMHEDNLPKNSRIDD